MNWRVLFVATVLVCLASAAMADGDLTRWCNRFWPFRAEAAICQGEVMRTAPRAVEGWTTVYHLSPRTRGKQVRGTWPKGATFLGREENGMFVARTFVGMNISGSSKPGCGNPSGACWAVRPPKPVVIYTPTSPVTVEVSIKETKIVTVEARPDLPPLSFGSGGGLALPAPAVPVGTLTVSQRQANVSLWVSWQRRQRQVYLPTPIVVSGTCPPVTPGTQPQPPVPGSGVIETPNPQAGIGWPGAPVAPGAPLDPYPPPVIGGPGSVTPLMPSGA